jgi:hypothetical protein
VIAGALAPLSPGARRAPWPAAVIVFSVERDDPRQSLPSVQDPAADATTLTAAARDGDEASGRAPGRVRFAGGSRRRAVPERRVRHESSEARGYRELAQAAP